MRQLEVKVSTKPFEDDTRLYRGSKLTFKPGVTVLVGCNGSGKTTLLNLIYYHCRQSNIPYISFDNYKNGGLNSLSSMRDLLGGNRGFSAFMNSWTFSEGERISENIAVLLSKLRAFIQTGEMDTTQKRISKLMKKIVNDNGEHEDVDGAIDTDKRVILLDGIDSGFSIDNVIDLQDVLKVVVDDAEKMGKEVYILMSANEYELACNSDCFDIWSGEYIKFQSYMEYKKFILKSRERKNKRHGENDKS